MNFRLTLCIGIVLLACWTIAPAQQATEIYIPIGESPGISGDESIIGSISSIDYQRYQMTVSTVDGRQTLTMTKSTRYYIDRNAEKKRNMTGDVEDCEVGSRIEAYVNEEGVVVWVKVTASE